MPHPTPRHDYHDDANAFVWDAHTDRPDAPPQPDSHTPTERVRCVAHEPVPVDADTPAFFASDPYPPVGATCCTLSCRRTRRGAFARVYLARQESLANRLVALEGHAHLDDRAADAREAPPHERDPSVLVHEAGSVPGRVHAVPGPDHAGPRSGDLPDRIPTSARALFWQLPGARDHELSRASYTDGCFG